MNQLEHETNFLRNCSRSSSSTFFIFRHLEALKDEIFKDISDFGCNDYLICDEEKEWESRLDYILELLKDKFREDTGEELDELSRY